MDKKTNVLLRDEIFNALIKSNLDNLQESDNVIVDKLSSFRDEYGGEDSSIGNLGQIYYDTETVLLNVTLVLQRKQEILHVQKNYQEYIAMAQNKDTGPYIKRLLEIYQHFENLYNQSVRLMKYIDDLHSLVAEPPSPHIVDEKEYYNILKEWIQQYISKREDSEMLEILRKNKNLATQIYTTDDDFFKFTQEQTSSLRKIQIKARTSSHLTKLYTSEIIFLCQHFHELAGSYHSAKVKQLKAFHPIDTQYSWENEPRYTRKKLANEKYQNELSKYSKRVDTHEPLNSGHATESVTDLQTDIAKLKANTEFINLFPLTFENVTQTNVMELFGYYA